MRVSKIFTSILLSSSIFFSTHSLLLSPATGSIHLIQIQMVKMKWRSNTTGLGIATPSHLHIQGYLISRKLKIGGPLTARTSNSEITRSSSLSGPLNKTLLLSSITDNITNEANPLSLSTYAYSFWFRSSCITTNHTDYAPVISEPARFCWASTNTYYSIPAYHKLSDSTYVKSPVNINLSTNTWYRLAVSWNGKNPKSYLNKNCESGNTTTSWSDITSIITGYSNNLSSRNNLLLSDIRYYDQNPDDISVHSLYHVDPL